MSNPRRFWGALAGAVTALVAVVDLAAARGPADGDTLSECIAGALDTPAKRAAATGAWVAFAVWFPLHIFKDRTPTDWLRVDLTRLTD